MFNNDIKLEANMSGSMLVEYAKRYVNSTETWSMCMISYNREKATELTIKMLKGTPFNAKKFDKCFNHILARLTEHIDDKLGKSGHIELKEGYSK